MELSDDALRSIVAHLAHLRAEYGDVLGEPDLVEPTSEYFPDDFAVDPEGIDALLRRMLTYVPVSSELEVKLAFAPPEGDAKSAGGGGCGGGACGTGAATGALAAGAVETEEGYAVVLSVADVSDPTVLTSAIARALGRVVLHEAGEDVDPRAEGALSELTAVACGLGLLLFNGASVYKKGCGGMRQHQATFLGTNELALALALFTRTAEKKAGLVGKHLAPTQADAWRDALAWVDAQPRLVRALREMPETLTDGVFALEEKKGLLGRLLARKEDDGFAGPVKIRERSEEERRRIAEARALVEEAFEKP
jgi:hypothetical protein